MGKMSKTAGAIALSAALALGTAVPAFATTPDGVTIDGNQAVQGTETFDGTGGYTKEGENLTARTAGGEGSSTVRVLSRVSQINATVPVMVYVVANTAGGELLAVPSGAGAALGKAVLSTADTSADPSAKKGTIAYRGYRIENNSTSELYVTHVVADDAEKDADGVTAIATGEWTYMDDATNIATSAVESGKVGNIHLAIKPFMTDTANYTGKLAEAIGTTEGEGATPFDKWVAGNSGAATGKLLDADKKTRTSASKAGAEFPVAKKSNTLGDTTTGKISTTGEGGDTIFGWTIEPAVYTSDNATPGVLGLQLSGKTSRILRSTELTFSNLADAYGEDAAQASGIGDIRLIYTVSAAAPTA